MEDSRKLDVSSNPFTALFPSVEQAEAYSRQQTQPTSNTQGNTELESQEVTCHACPLALSLKHSVDSVSESDPTNQHSHFENDDGDDDDKPQMINDLLQRVFLITVDPDRSRVGRREYGGLPKRCVYLKNTASDSEVPLIHWTNIDEALMERLMMSYPRTHVMITGGAYGTALTAEIEAGESGVIKYLAACYRRATEDQKKWKGKSPEYVEKAEKARTLTVSYAGTCLLSPEVFSKSDPQKQLFHLLLTVQGDLVIREFMDRLVQEHCRKDDLTCMFMPVLTMLKERSSDITSLVQPDVHNYLNILSFFGRHRELTEILSLSDSWFPPKPQIGYISGRAFEKQSILGCLLGLTSMSQDPTKPYEFFQRPAEQSQSEMQATMANLRTYLNSLVQGLHKVVLEIIKRSNESRHGILHWIGACLYSNLSRKKMMGELFAATQSHDGFFLNLSMLLLKLCQPFMDGNSPKLLKINPQYCAVRTTIDSIANKNTGLHLVELDKETRLVVPANEEHITVENPPAFGFVTECFFMTHYCLNLGLWKVCEKYRKLMTDLNQMQQVYQEASSHGSEGPLIDRLKVQFENGIIKQLSLKTHLLNPSLIELSLRFYIATASWLNQVALAGDNFDNMTAFRDVEIPLPSQTPPGLLFVPEFIVETMADFVIFLRHFSEETLESAGRSLQHLVTFFVIYMGSPERVRNPHLRAKLAETVEALIPVQRSNMSSGLLAGSQINMFNRQLAFLQHSVAPAYLPQALLRLFVDIEFTGHTMQFEQKFGYRHHMYSVLHFMWNQENYKATLLKLGEEAAEAETKMTSNLPVFLRFLNLLINDSIFLLDEALQYMTTLKKLQSERDNGSWDSLSEQARQQKQQELQQTGGMARSHNILANETVRALSYITADIKRPFLSGCMRRRIADMLNYFLFHLVGPKMGALKVKDFSEFHFKPQQLVSDIVDIYLNLGQDDSFCHAVATDDRSYSPSLFVQSERVLKLIGRPASIVKLNELAQRVKEFAQQEKADADDMPEPPDEFVDPITNTIMDDPVTLPTSSIVVDRATICRHLLSDQTDPFSRRPLTLEMVEPNEELKARIQNWLKEVKARKKR